MDNLLRAAGWTAVIVVAVAAYAINPFGFAGTVLILGSAAALTPTVREPLRQGWPGWKPSPATRARAERAGRWTRTRLEPHVQRARGRLTPLRAVVARQATSGAGDAQVIVDLTMDTAERRRLAALEQARAAATDDPEVRAEALAAAAWHLDQVHQHELELTDLRAEPPPCPECDGYLGWHPSECATCATVASQSPPPAIDTHPEPLPSSASAPVCAECGGFPGQRPATCTTCRHNLAGSTAPDLMAATDSTRGMKAVEEALERLVAEIEAAGEPGAAWPTSQDTGRYSLDFNSGVFADPYLASSGYLPSRQAAGEYADLVLPRLHALEDQARPHLHPDDQDGADWPAYVTVVSERRDPDWGESGDPVYEQDYDPTRPAAPPADRSIKEELMSTTATTTSTTGSELGTAGRASIQGLIVDWESSVEARSHPETFIAWLQAQAAAAQQRAQMVPELVATYHGRGPSGHAGVPDAQITAFSLAYEESATQEAAAYAAWAQTYAAYVEAAEEEMTRTYGREVIGSAHAAHNG